MDADLRARRMLRKQREDAEYLSNVRPRRSIEKKTKDKTSSISMITTPPKSNVRNDIECCEKCSLGNKRRKEDKILAVHMEEARRVALVAAQAAKIAYVVLLFLIHNKTTRIPKH